MLKTIKRKIAHATGGKFAIVASCYNSEYVDAMLRAAREELLNAGTHVHVVRVPAGKREWTRHTAFELYSFLRSARWPRR